MRSIWVLLTSLLCAGLTLAGGWLVLARSAAPPAASALQLAFTHDARSTRALLDQACQRDVQLERLAIELSAGASDVSGARQATQLAKLLGGTVRLFVERGGKAHDLTRDAATDLPSVTQLQRVATERGVLEGQLWDSCALSRGDTRLWLTRSLAVDQLLKQAGLDPAGFAQSEQRTPDDVLLPDLAQAGALSVHARTQGSADGELFGLLLGIAGVGALLGAVLALLATRSQPVDEAVLDAIESAATRVAQGDLSSQISLSVSGRADQTLRSFDRMTHELRETRAKLREAERAAAWQDMAQRIAHEIKNPLSPIKLALETLRKAHDKRLAAFDEIFEESTHAMLEEVQRMEHIVREFSQFARLPKARPGALDLASLVHETAGLYAPKDVALQLTLPDALPVHADREQLVQVVVNLLANAGDAARTQVTIGARDDGEHVLLWVDDDGPGVAAEQRERIFEPYVTNKAHGTGLGLAIVRRIAQDHGGSITVADAPTGGARFTLKLPRGARA